MILIRIIFTSLDVKKCKISINFHHSKNVKVVFNLLQSNFIVIKIKPFNVLVINLKATLKIYNSS